MKPDYESAGSVTRNAVGGVIHKAAPLEGAAGNDTRAAKLFSGRRILVADDVMTSRIALSCLLESLGCVVDAAGDGAEAMHKVRCNGYDAVMMDCQMPVVDGYTATRLLREEGRVDLPIVAVTATSTEEDRQAVKNSGVSDYLAKPFVKSDLVQVLLKIWK